MTIQELVKLAEKESPNASPRAIKVDANAEEALMINFFGPEYTASKKGRRNFIERKISMEKPSGIEVIIWNQDLTEVCLWVQKATN